MGNAKKSGGQAFEAQRESIFRFDPDDVVIIGHDTKHKKGEHPLYQEVVEPTPEFVANVGHFGVQEPILVAKDGDAPVVVAGRKRLRALRIVNAERRKTGQPPLMISAKQVKGPESMLAAVMVIENEQRHELDAVARGEQVCQLALQGFSPADLATIYGRSAATIQNLQALGSATFELKRLVREGKITAARGYTLARKSADKQRAAVAAIEAGKPEKAAAPKAKDPKRVASGVLQRLVDLEEPIKLALAQVGLQAHDYTAFCAALRQVVDTAEVVDAEEG